MKDLTQNSVGRHILQMAVPIAAGHYDRVREAFKVASMAGA